LRQQQQKQQQQPQLEPTLQEQAGLRAALMTMLVVVGPGSESNKVRASTESTRALALYKSTTYSKRKLVVCDTAVP
jgi:hypothetical protein